MNKKTKKRSNRRKNKSYRRRNKKIVKGGTPEWIVWDSNQKKYKNIKFIDCIPQIKFENNSWIITTDENNQIIIPKDKTFIKKVGEEEFYPVGCFLHEVVPEEKMNVFDDVIKSNINKKCQYNNESSSCIFSSKN
jgi:hypothetical protein